MKMPLRVTIIAALFFVPLISLSTSYFGLQATDVAYVLFFISVGFGYLIHRILKKREQRHAASHDGNEKGKNGE